MGGDTSPEQLYALRWNDHESSILSSFRHLRDEEDFVDVTLACEGCSFTAHKVVLSACSPYFKNLLKANPCTHPIVILKDVPKKDMENLLRFMYNGEVNIGQEHLAEFLKTAQMLQVRGLVELESKVQQQPTSQKLTPQGATSLTWSNERTDRDLRDREQSPPAKRSRQENQENQGAFTPRVRSPSRGNNGDTQDTLLGQALEGGPTLHTPAKNNSDNSSLQEQTTGEDSSDDTQMSEQDREVKTEVSDYQMDDHHPYSTNGSGLMDPSRAPSFPGAALLNLSGLPGLLPGTSSLNDFTANARRSLDMLQRVRATDPRPCPKCGKIYRSAHTLRTHLEDKHTICPGYRCVLCGTVAKSRNSLHSHMSRQHRGISTKDLPVLPMPAPFDPDLASRLLAKAGLKVSAAELKARASPTGPRRSDVKLDAKSAYSGAASEEGSSICDDNDPEDLTTSHARYNMDFMQAQMNHMNPSMMKLGKHNSAQALAAKSSLESLHNLSKEPSYPTPLGPPTTANSTGSPLLDTYLQFMNESGLGIHNMIPEQAAAMHAAKLAQLNAFGGLEKTQQHFLEKMQQMTANDMMMKRNDEIRRGDGDGLVINEDHEREKDEGDSSGGEEEEYSDDDPDGAKE